MQVDLEANTNPMNQQGDDDLEANTNPMNQQGDDDDDGEIRDTGTIHMFAVTAVTQTENPNRCLRAWFFAFISLTFIMIQSTAFYMIIKEADVLPYSAHTYWKVL
jgi:hypothetical protein